MRGFKFLLLLGVAAMAGCQPKKPDAPIAEASQCSAQAQSPWGIAAGQVYAISAMAAGPDCAKSVITLVVRAGDETPLFATALLANAGNLAFGDVQDSADMQKRLQDWLAPAQAGFTTSADLPAWPEGASGPTPKAVEGVSGSFPFFPDPEAYSERSAYEALRAAKSPVFCYVQGTESYACLAAQDGAVFSIGLQVFPG